MKLSDKEVTIFNDNLLNIKLRSIKDIIMLEKYNIKYNCKEYKTNPYYVHLDTIQKSLSLILKHRESGQTKAYKLTSGR